jgi:hypothetical protein
MHSDFTEWDVISGPLLDFNVTEMRNTVVRGLVDELTDLESVNVFACCTDTGAEYVSEQMRMVVVIGLGNGVVGVNGESWDTAGIRQSTKVGTENKELLLV